MLNKITIDNFKSLKHLEYDCTGLNLLTGMNGAGKSSFIQFLLMMKALPEMGNKCAVESCVRGWNTGAYDYDDVHYRYSGNLVGCKIDFDVEYYGGRHAPVVRTAKIGRQFGPKDDRRVTAVVVDDFQFEKYVKAKLKEGTEDADIFATLMRDLSSPVERLAAGYSFYAEDGCQALDEDEGRFPQDMIRSNDEFQRLIRRLKFVSAFRGAPVDIQDGSRMLTDDFEAGGLDSEGNDVYAYLAEKGNKIFLYDVDPRIFPDSELKCWDDNLAPVGMNVNKGKLYTTLSEQICMWMSTVSPGATLQLKGIRVGGDVKIETKVVYGSSGETKRSFKPQNVGFGVSYSLLVIVILLSAKRGDILVIENPEAHLHPRGQAAMGNLIARAVAAGVQVFVETHSDHLINGVRVAVKKGIVKPEDVNIAFFERGPHNVSQEDGTTNREIYSEVTNIKVDENGSLSEWPKDFMDEWGIQQMKLLRP